MPNSSPNLVAPIPQLTLKRQKIKIQRIWDFSKSTKRWSINSSTLFPIILEYFFLNLNIFTASRKWNHSSNIRICLSSLSYYKMKKKKKNFSSQPINKEDKCIWTIPLPNVLIQDHKFETNTFNLGFCLATVFKSCFQL